MRPQQSPYPIAALLLAVIYLCAGCDPAKKALRQQKNYRELTNDFLLHNPVKLDTGTTFLPGKVDNTWSNFWQAPYTPERLQFWKSDTASVQKVKDSLAVVFNIQRQVEAIDCNRQVNEAFDVGYQSARHELQEKIKQLKKPAPDTIVRTITNTTLQTKQGEQIKFLEGQLSEARNKQTFLWHFIVAVFFDAVFLVMLFRKSTA